MAVSRLRQPAIVAEFLDYRNSQSFGLGEFHRMACHSSTRNWRTLQP